MANFNLSANMNLPIPVVGVDPGPDYALNIDNCMTLLDGHDHTLGKGIQITPAGLNINSDLSFQSNNAVALRTSRFAAQSAALSLPADIGCVYVAGLDLYYNDISGNQIRITQGGSVAGSTGTITGLPSGTASASYNAGTFVFQSSTNVGANIDGRNYVLRNNVVNSKGLTLSPPNAMPSDYGISFPFLPVTKGILTLNSSGTMAVEPTPPGATSLVTMDSAGNLGTFAIPPTVAPISAGGTNNGSTGVVAGGIYYGDGTRFQETAAGALGQTLQSNAAAAPTWVSAVASQYTTSSAASSPSQPIDFATLSFDPGSYVTTGSSWHFTCPYTGVYNVSVTGSNDTGVVALSIYKNGSAGIILFDSSSAARPSGSSLVNCTAGDTLDVRANSSVNVTSASISIHLVR